MRRILAAGTLALVSALLLSGCIAPEPTPDPQPTRTPRPTATADAAPPTATPDAAAPTTPPIADVPAPVVTTVVIRPLGLDLLDSSGSHVGYVSYDDDADLIAEELSWAFGIPPEVEELPGRCCHAPRTTTYVWPGFEVLDDHVGTFSSEDPTVWIADDGPDLYEMNVFVTARVGSVNGRVVTTDSGYSYGEEFDGFAKSLVWSSPDGGVSYAEYRVETGPDLGPSQVEGERNAYSVVVQTGSDSDYFPRIVAPLNLGIGRA